jgi:NTE family protein
MARADSQPKKIGLALSGGSTWGIAHVGVLEAFAEAGIAVDMVAGTSAGSLVAACYAFGMPIEAMKEATGNVSWRKLSKFTLPRMGLKTNAPMREYLTDLLGDVRIEDAQIPLAIVAADIRSHEKVVLREGSVHEAVRASTAIPGFFKPIELNGRLLVDGAIAENVPVPTLRDMGADIVIGVNLFSRSGGWYPKNIIDVMRSSFSALSYHHVSTLARTADIVIEPDLSGFDGFKFRDADKIRLAGYEAAKAALPRILERTRPVEEPATLASRIGQWFGLS